MIVCDEPAKVFEDAGLPPELFVPIPDLLSVYVPI
jgi:hypothetical protein